MEDTPRITFGIAPLRELWSQQLLSQIAAELPRFVSEIEMKSTACRERLQNLAYLEMRLDVVETEFQLETKNVPVTRNDLYACACRLMLEQGQSLPRAAPSPYVGTVTQG